MVATGVAVGLAEWIIDNTCLVLWHAICNLHIKYKSQNYELFFYFFHAFKANFEPFHRKPVEKKTKKKILLYASFLHSIVIVA